MATIKSYTDLEQSKKLAKILPLESADMCWQQIYDENHMMSDYRVELIPYRLYSGIGVPCWSLAVLLKYLSEIKLQVYTPILFPSESKWILQFAEYGHGNVCEITSKNSIDACVAMVESLYKLNLL